MTVKWKLPLRDLEVRHPGLTKGLADSYGEAAAVCFDRHHRSPADVDVERNGSASVVVTEWQAVDDRMRGAWANEIDATEFGAYACALASVEVLDGLVAVRRAETMTGADYYVAPRGSSFDDLEDCRRLEVSGVDRGTLASVRRRLSAKLAQARAGDSDLPACAAVVGFKERIILLADL